MKIRGRMEIDIADKGGTTSGVGVNLLAMASSVRPLHSESEPVANAVAADDPSAVVIDYTNFRGERSERRILPDRVWFGIAEWHPRAQWILDAWDLEKGALRSFTMADIHSWRPAGPAPDA